MNLSLMAEERRPLPGGRDLSLPMAVHGVPCRSVPGEPGARVCIAA